MTEFKAPPLPQAPAFRPASTIGAQTQTTQKQAQEAPRSTSLYDDNFAADFNLPPAILTTKAMAFLMGVVCVIGIILGSMLFSSAEAPKSTGLQGVVRNQDITRNLPRCGMTDRGQACVLYIVNHTRYDRYAEDFFDEAVKLTEVQKYSIAIANPKYAKTRIPPGHFAQIQIPNVR